MKKTNLILLTFLLLFSLFIRIFDLSKNPPSLFSDEVDLGYHAFTFLKTGNDYFGNKFPISFHSFADYRAPLYIYSTVPFVAIFGLNEISVRLPAILFSLLGILFFFLLTKRISQSYFFAYISALLLSISPWYFHYSRIGFEATCVFFLSVAGLYYFFEFIYCKKYSNLIASVIFFSLTFYAYATARMFIPLLAVVVICVYRKEILDLGFKKNAILVVLTVFLLSFFTYDMFSGGSIHRFSYLNIFSDSNLGLEINRQRLTDTIYNKEQTVGMKPPISSLIFHNKPSSWLSTIINNYFSAISTNFLFLSGDQNPRHNLPKTGQLYLILFPFLLSGFYFSIKLFFDKKRPVYDPFNNKILLLFFLWLLLAPIPASITFDGGGHATRLFLMLPPLLFFISFGIWNIINFKFIKKYKIILILLVLIIFIESVNYYHKYFIHYSVLSGDSWHYGLKEIMLEVSKNEAQYDKIYISNSFEKPLMFFLFWTKFDPKEFNVNNLKNISNNEFEGVSMGKYYFGKIIAEKFFTKTKKEEKILVFSLRNEYGNDLNSHIFPNFSTIFIVNDMERNPKFYLLSNK